MKIRLIIVPLILLFSCRNATEKWLAGLSGHNEIRDKDLSLRLLRVKPQQVDTSSVTYLLRIEPAVKEKVRTGDMYYHMDSCFTLRAGSRQFTADLVEPIANGTAGSYEYLVSFPLDPSMRQGKLQLVYHDRYIDGRQYILDLNSK